MISVGDSTFTGTRSAAGSSRVRGGDVGAGVPGPVASVSDGSGSGSGSRRSGRRGTGASAFGATGACVVEGTGACAFGGADTTGSASGASLSGASVSGASVSGASVSAASVSGTSASETPVFGAWAGSGAVTGISPVSSATEMPPLTPRRRRPPAREFTFWPLRASSSATEICPVSVLLPSVIAKPPSVRPPISVSSLRRMSPSRRAQGQISRVSTPSARMAASATRAPATICCDRSELTPSSSARSAAVMREMNAMS